MKLTGFLLLLLIGLNAVAQETQQLVRGTIINTATTQPIAGCTIQITGIQKYRVESDSLGQFSIFVEVDTYTITVFKEGFLPVRNEHVEIMTGKQYILSFELSELNIQLPPVTIQGERGDRNIEIWQGQKYPATFSDPARVINTYAGAVNTDDQANNVSIYGTTPNYIQWKIEGVEVVNPNHLENAGTFNDKPALNGGGVSILSAQLLEKSRFQYAPFQALGGNALSGIFDIRFRKGNEKIAERTIQVGLLGTDVSLEGPFSIKSDAAYLFNYRYSTVGLLSQLGVNFGDEKINYQDFSFNISFPLPNGSIKTFGAWGTSKNDFDGKTDSTLLETQKDLSNIDYKSETGIGGLSCVVSLNNTSYVKLVSVYSAKDIFRKSIPTFVYPGYTLTETDNYQQQKLTSVAYFSKRLPGRVIIKGGSYFNYFINDLEAFSDQFIFGLNEEDLLLQPFAEVEGISFKKIELRAGLHGFYQYRLRYFDLQPRAEIIYTLADHHTLNLGYGKTAQLQPATLALFNPSNRDLPPTVSHAYKLIYNGKIKRYGIQTKLFYQQFSRIPVNTATGFSAYNYFNEAVPVPLSSQGKAETYGIDLTLETSFNRQYVIFSSVVYNSTYSVNNHNYYKSKYNTGYNIVISTGKEYRLKNKNKFFSYNVKGTLREGFRENRSNPVSYNYPDQLPWYYRIDLRVSLRKDRPRSSFIWALDIQNVTNHKNTAYHYYDSFTTETETKYQLGIIPVLSLRILF